MSSSIRDYPLGDPSRAARRSACPDPAHFETAGLRRKLTSVSKEDPVIESLKEALNGRKDVRLAMLFGSRARGRARSGSDADVAVLGDNLDLLELAADLSDAARVEVDVVSLEDPGFPLLNALLRDGIVLHEAERYAAASW